MADSVKLQQLVENTVEETVGRQVAVLKSQLVERIKSQLAADVAVPAASNLSELAVALREIQKGLTQADILGALLDCAGGFTGRVGLFVLRSGSFVGWRGRGFGNHDLKGMALDSSCALVTRVLETREPVEGTADSFDASFLARLSSPAEGSKVGLLPLMIREKVAALIYADGGVKEQRSADLNALDCLVRFAGLWIEVTGARRGMGASASESELRSAPTESTAGTSSLTSPVSHPHMEAPLQQAASVAPVPSPRTTEPRLSNHAPSVPPSEARRMPPCDGEEVDRKARRFARLLVDEIKLYNEGKVEEGRTHADLYSRLKVEIEKSRAAYDRRYGEAVAAGEDYFQQELVRILANNNPSLLGSPDPS